MVFNNEILNKIVEQNNTKNNVSNSIGLDNIDYQYLQMIKKGAKIYIKPKNRGKFTASAKRAGESVQEHAHKVMRDPNASALQKKRANFAIQAKKWHKK